MSLNTPDLTKFPPRSPRVRLGGYVILPRMLDKGRATVAGKNGEYHYACPLDQGFLEFVGIDPEALKKQTEPDRLGSPGLDQQKRQILNVPCRKSWPGQRGRNRAAPDNPESREHFNDIQKAAAPKREDIATWFDVLDVDDYVSFGGKA